MAGRRRDAYSLRMRHKTADAPYRHSPTPEEIVLDGWLEDSSPYVSLRDTVGPRARASGLRAGPVTRPEAAEA
jgi:hypothetical protein